MIDPESLNATRFSEVLLVSLHKGWMTLDVVWLEALAFFLLAIVIVPLLL